MLSGSSIPMNPTDKLRVHPEAALELRSARRWYKQRNQKAGEAFGLEYKATVGRIIQAPLRWPMYVQGTRRHLMHRFPYAIVYRAESDGAVLMWRSHTRRKTRLTGKVDPRFPIL